MKHRIYLFIFVFRCAPHRHVNSGMYERDPAAPLCIPFLEEEDDEDEDDDDDDDDGCKKI